MNKFNDVFYLSKMVDEILDTIENIDDITTSDLQSVVEVQINKAYQLGRRGGDNGYEEIR